MHRSNEPRNPRLALEADHAQIEALLHRLAVHVRADEPREGLRIWAVLEPAVLAHLDAEEAYLVPGLMESERAECERVLGDHRQIRRMLGELGMALELHTARLEPVVAFCAFLEAHAEREESLLYPIAERNMPVVAARSLVSRLRAIDLAHPHAMGRPRTSRKASRL